MTYKTILTVCSSDADSLQALDQAEALARHTNGHLDVLCLGIDHTQVNYYDGGATAMAVQSLFEDARADLAITQARIKDHLRTCDVPLTLSTAVVPMGNIGRVTAHHARFSDLVVMPLPYAAGSSADVEPIVEAALFEARTPVLALPAGARLPNAPKTVLVAWDESMEALTAIQKALPLLQAADLVRIAVIDPPQHGTERSDPGGMLCQMLARHGVICEIDVLSKTLPRVSNVLNRHAQDSAAELIVMGAYGHSRFREAILGGTTRSMLEHAQLPVFLAH